MLTSGIIGSVFKAIPSVKFTVVGDTAIEFAGSTSPSVSVDWGDGQALVDITSTQVVVKSYNDGRPSHQVKVYGSCGMVYLGVAGYETSVISVDDWGNGGFYLDNASIFSQSILTGCLGLQSVPEDAPPITNFNHLFRGIEGIPSEIVSWDTSNVTNMNAAFKSTTGNINLSTWDTSNVTDMSFMFEGYLGTNIVTGFNTSKVVTMEGMFLGCTNFNSSVSSFDTSSVVNFSSMFEECRVFNQPIDNFITSNGILFEYMFSSCHAFNQPINHLDLSNATSAAYMFNSCLVLNQSTTGMDFSNISNFSHMFYNADRLFNLDLGYLENGTNFAFMFAAMTYVAFTSLKFPPGANFVVLFLFSTVNATNIDISAVTSLNTFFANAYSVNGSLGDTSHITSMSYLFSEANNVFYDFSAFDISGVTSLSGMFNDVDNFTGDLSSWDTGHITDMSYMFADSNITNPQISAWDVSSVVECTSFRLNSSLACVNTPALPTLCTGC